MGLFDTFNEHYTRAKLLSFILKENSTFKTNDNRILTTIDIVNIKRSLETPNQKTLENKEKYELRKLMSLSLFFLLKSRGTQETYEESLEINIAQLLLILYGVIHHFIYGKAHPGSDNYKKVEKAIKEEFSVYDNYDTSNINIGVLASNILTTEMYNKIEGEDYYRTTFN